MHLKSDYRVDKLINTYPKHVQGKLFNLRNLILETANEVDQLHELEETLKWGEPSYTSKIGSTLRFDWKDKTPNQYALYFSCSSKLVSTFKSVFGNLFNYEKNRAIIFNFNDVLPQTELKHCIKMALQYKKVKHLPYLGL